MTLPKNPTIRNVSKRIVRPVIRYLDGAYGPEITAKILNEIGQTRFYFDDLDGFMPQEITEKLKNAAIKHTGDPEFSYHMGRNIVKYANKMEILFTATFASPVIMFQNMEKLEQRLVKTTKVDSKRVGKNRFILTISNTEGYAEPASACRNRQGIYEAAPTPFGLPFARVAHPQCAFRGDQHCVYDVTIPEYRFYWLRKIALFLGGVCLIGGIFSILLQNMVGLVAWGGVANLSLFLYLLFMRKNAFQTLKWGQEANQTLQAHSDNLKEENARMEFLYNLVIELNRHVTTKSICTKVVEVLVRDFNYDSCQIWIVDEYGKLTCKAASGYDDTSCAVMSDINYSLAQEMNQPQSIFVKVLLQKETLLIKDVKTESLNYSNLSLEFLSLLNSSSAIIVPLIDKDRAIGILIGLNRSGKQISYADHVLFEATAQIVSNSLIKAGLYQNMEEKITSRSKQIKRHQQELLAIRKMEIQSEKVSALGKMAAGVAHEINNPLNFLINIVPDLKNDMEGLEKIMQIGTVSLSNSRCKEQLDALIKSYQLKEHLAESSYVFDSIKRSLNKAKNIANSLKVFARTPRKEEINRENLLELIRSAIELIPQKYRSDAHIQVDVDPAHTLFANRIEIIQLFLNLIQNALEAGEGKGKIGITAKSFRDAIEIEITDQGKGIPPEIDIEVFKPFFTTKNDGQHLGLGLTIALEIVKKYAGDIQIKSTSDKGTILAVRINKAYKNKPHK
jgi:signal transduction histidine kinase